MIISIGILTAGLLAIGADPTPITVSTIAPGPTPIPASTQPRRSPPPIPPGVELYFHKAAKIISWKGDTRLEVTEEVPFLTEADFATATIIPRKDFCALRIELTTDGLEKLKEASLGNIGRNIVFSLDGECRNLIRLGHEYIQNIIMLGGKLTPEEAEAIARRINFAPLPTPLPFAEPTPTPESDVVIF